MFEDRKLIDRSKQGDKAALRCIYEKYKDDLLTVSLSMLREEKDAEEVLGEVFAAFAGGMGQFYLFGSLKSYLMTCVISRVRERLRKRMYHVEGLDSRGPLRSNLLETDESINNNEERELLTKLAELPAVQREVIVLHLQGGMKFREIAGLQATTTAAVRGRYRYGLEKLGAIMRSEIIE
jgi:RNA polymerase sigma-70 factor, ECF subfamily